MATCWTYKVGFDKVLEICIVNGPLAYKGPHLLCASHAGVSFRSGA